jgi:MFS family permease
VSIAAQKMMVTLKWSKIDKGLMLSSFYIGYTVGQIPFSILVQLYGVKLTFGLSIIVSSILTLLIPISCETSFTLALILRVFIGFFESAAYSAIGHFIPIWIPLIEKTLLLSFIFCGCYFGEAIAFSLSGYLIDHHINFSGFAIGGWQSVFYIFGTWGVVWYPFFLYFIYETPENHPFISIEEIEFIKKGFFD